MFKKINRFNVQTRVKNIDLKIFFIIYIYIYIYIKCYKKYELYIDSPYIDTISKANIIYLNL